MLTGQDKLEHARALRAVEMPVYGPNPGNFEKHIQTLPRKALWVAGGDGPDQFLEVRTPTYATVQNADLFQAIQDVAYDRDINLDVHKCTYHGGNTLTHFTLPDEAFKVTGDRSAILPGIWCKNSYGNNGGSAVTLDPCSLDDWCSNGLVFNYKSMGEVQRRRHSGTISYDDVYLMVCKSFDNLSNHVEVTRLTAEVAASTPISDEQITRFLEELNKSTAKKYQPTVEQIVQENTIAMDQTVWGVLQGISEVYQHHMDAPVHGGTKLAWRDGAVDRLLKETMVKETVEASIGR